MTFSPSRSARTKWSMPSTSPGPRSRNHSLPHRIQDKLRHAVQVQLLQDVPAMRLYGVQTQVENRSHFFIRLALRQQLQNLPLARGEQFVAVFHPSLLHPPHATLHHHLADGRAEEGFALIDGATRIA